METKEKNKAKNRRSVSEKFNRWIENNPKLNNVIDTTGYYIKHPDKFTDKINEIYSKATNDEQRKSISEFVAKIKSLYRMVKMGWNGEYTGIPKARLVMGGLALAYLVSPVDIIPDALPFIGFIDEAALLIWLVKQANDEVVKFEQWEQQHNLSPAH
jgi:uncharacterized membrane protein YkvA (DUF1232 family)